MATEPMVFVVDDDPAVRHSLTRLMASVQLPVAAYGTAEEFLDDYSADQPGCALVDVRMPGMSGLELQQRLAAEPVALPVIIITGHGDVSMAVRALQHGAFDFVEKPIRGQALLDTISKAIDVDRERRRAHADRAEARTRIESLTPREHVTMELVVAGRTNAQIAAQLGVTAKTVEFHRSNVSRKLQTENVQELVRLAWRAGQLKEAYSDVVG